MDKNSFKYNIIDRDLFSQREKGEAHTSYKTEVEFYTNIQNGDLSKMEQSFENVIEGGLVLGRFSQDNLRQVKYWAVCCITLATRYAIKGGLDEKTAFNFSDNCIFQIDLMVSEQEIIDFMIKKSREITIMVSENKENKSYPKSLKKCIKYIDDNLHSDLSLKELSKFCGLSASHISFLFRNYIGTPVSFYIREKRLQEGRELLKTGMTVSEAAYNTGFCSESYFIKCYKELFGVTPGKG